MKSLSIPFIGSYVVLTESIPFAIRGSLSAISKEIYRSEGWWETSLHLEKGDWFEVSTIILPKKAYLDNDITPRVWVKLLRSKSDRRFLKNRLTAGMKLLKSSVIVDRQSKDLTTDLRWREWIPYSHMFKGDDLAKLVWVPTKEQAIALRTQLTTEPALTAKTDLDRFDMV